MWTGRPPAIWDRVLGAGEVTRCCCAAAQVFVHCLRKVDMRAVIGQTSQTSVVVRGAHTTRRVACYSSHPDELQVHTHILPKIQQHRLANCLPLRAFCLTDTVRLALHSHAQVAPTAFVLVSGALSELLLSFRPVTQGIRDIKVRCSACIMQFTQPGKTLTPCLLSSLCVLWR